MFLCVLGARLGAGEGAHRQPEAAEGARVARGAQDVVGAVVDDGDPLARRDAEADELVARIVRDGEDAAAAAAEGRQAGAVPEAEGAGVGAGGEVDLGVVDHGHGVARRQRAEVAEVDEEPAAGAERQLELLPGHPGQEAGAALVDGDGAEVAPGAAGAEDLRGGAVGLGEQPSTARIISSATRCTPVGPAARNLPLKAIRVPQRRGRAGGRRVGGRVRVSQEGCGQGCPLRSTICKHNDRHSSVNGTCTRRHFR